MPNPGLLRPLPRRVPSRPRPGRLRRSVAALSALAVLACVLAVVPAHAAAPPPPDQPFVATQLPDTVAGRQVAWLLEASARLPIPEEEIRAHFTRSFLALPGVSPADINRLLGAALDPAGARLVGVSVAQPDGIVAVISGRGGQALTLTFVVDRTGLVEYATLQFTPSGPAVALPAPTGPAAVGTDTVELVDRTRAGRRLMLTRTYPAARGAAQHPLAPYASARLAIATALPSVRTAARLDAAPRPGRLPVVLFSPGFGTPRVLYQALAEDLASHGYLVIAVDHTGEAPVEFPDGSMALPGAPSGSPQRLIAAAAATRLADMRLLRHRLGRLPSGPRADLRRVAAVGHSLGGSTAAALMRVEPAVRAGVDMDGSIFGPAEKQGVDRPFLVMAGWRGLDPTLRRFLRHSHGPRLALRFAGLEHLSFSDLPAILPTAVGGRRAPSAQDIAPQRRYLRAFLDRFVRGRAAALPEATSRGGRVHVAYRRDCCAAAG
jgi:dienelactone hydrolase